MSQHVINHLWQDFFTIFSCWECVPRFILQPMETYHKYIVWMWIYVQTDTHSNILGYSQYIFSYKVNSDNWNKKYQIVQLHLISHHIFGQLCLENIIWSHWYIILKSIWISLIICNSLIVILELSQITKQHGKYFKYCTCRCICHLISFTNNQLFFVEDLKCVSEIESFGL